MINIRKRIVNNLNDKKIHKESVPNIVVDLISMSKVVFFYYFTF